MLSRNFSFVNIAEDLFHCLLHLMVRLFKAVSARKLMLGEGRQKAGTPNDEVGKGGVVNLGNQTNQIMGT